MKKPGRPKKNLNINVDTKKVDVKITRKDGKTDIKIDTPKVDVDIHREKGNNSLKIDSDEINVHSKEHQQYFLYSDVNELNDNDTACWMAYDKEGERCRIYLLRNDVGETFLMVEYNDVSWIYNLIMTK